MTYDLGISCRLVVSFKLLLLYPRRKMPLYAFNRRLGGPIAGVDDIDK
jgi:hypothetical protein